MKYIVILLALIISIKGESRSCVTFTGLGRLGDNLVAYLHAQWLAYVYDLELLLTTYPYFDELIFYDQESMLTSCNRTFISKKVFDNPGEPLVIDPNADILYVIPYFPEGIWERAHDQGFNFNCNWNDEIFLKRIRTLIKPKRQLETPILSSEVINIAVHIRKGGGVDAPLYSRCWYKNNADVPFSSFGYCDVAFPAKHPPLGYYIEQLQKIVAICKDVPLCVHIITDDLNPTAVMEEVKKDIIHPAITFKCRVEGNGPSVNVLEDLFAMTTFDILIRPDSNISIVADKLHDYLCVVSPLECKWSGNRLTIPQQKLRLNLAHPKYYWIQKEAYRFDTGMFSRIEKVSMLID